MPSSRSCSPYKAAIRQRLAEIVGVSPGTVGLKAKTGEGVGAVGQGEIIAAQCVVLLDDAVSARKGNGYHTIKMKSPPTMESATIRPLPAIRVYNTLTKTQGTVRARHAGQGRHLPLRADGLQAEPHRPHGRPGDLRRHQALPGLLRLRGDAGSSTSPTSTTS